MVNDPLVQQLLWACMPMLKHARGDENGAAFRRAWIEATKGCATMRASDAVKASSPADAARALFQLTLELGDAAGLPRTSFVELFNARGESGVQTPAAMLDEVIDRGGSLILSLAVARQEADCAETKREIA